ncbi:MAG: trypsin-like peptidase domain-containing protein [Acidobacteria bacterium]|nr:trypsin-like peptidase domain-containing protein [Acidobacteriota bacterium]
MSFTHFTDERLLELWRGIIEVDLIPVPGSASPRPAEAEPRALAELKRLNTIKRSRGGQVPLLLWLRDAVTLSEGLRSGLLFRQALSDLAARVSGQKPIPDPAKFPEYYANFTSPPEVMSHAFLTAGGEACRGVARLCVPRFDGGSRTVFDGYPLIHDGTAWLITPSLLVTSYHAVNARSSEEGHSAQADLRRQVTHSFAEFAAPAHGAQPLRLGVESLQICNRQLDFVILRLTRPAGPEPLSLASGRVSTDKDTGTPVNVINCPAGQSQQVSVRGNILSAVTNHESGTNSRGCGRRYVPGAV